MKFKYASAIYICLFPTLCHAFLCPTTFNQYFLGDTEQQVQAQCGKPDKQETKEVEPDGPQEWTYYIPQTVANDTMGQMQGTLKTTISFDDTGKVNNISVNGLGVGSSNICGGTIQLGDPIEAVKTACGEPSAINKQVNPNVTKKPQEKTKVTTFIYNSQSPVKLIFTNGTLTSKE